VIFFSPKQERFCQGLNASFVNVGYPKDGFLHYHDLGPHIQSLNKFIKNVSTGKYKDYTLKNFQFEKEIDKNGSIDQVLKTKQNVLVQVVKEPISTKGPRISSELSIAGRFLVLVPFSKRVSCLSKDSRQQRKRPLKTFGKKHQTPRVWDYFANGC
jgi:ribonuclease G